MLKLNFSDLTRVQKECLFPVITDDVPAVRHSLQAGWNSNSFDLFQPMAGGDDHLHELAAKMVIFVSVMEKPQRESLYLLNVAQKGFLTPELNAGVYRQAPLLDSEREGGAPVLKAISIKSLLPQQLAVLGLAT